MSERKLASIQRIIDIQPIPGADKIEVSTVLGWKCVVLKNQFKIGDACVYIEIDSIVPTDKPVFEFMKERKGRVRTIKLKQQISQGLVLPWTILPLKKKGCSCFEHQSQYNEGDDVTEVLSIVKYDPEGEKEMSGTPKKKKNFFHRFMLRFLWYRKVFGSSRERFNWPDFLIKTDETRLQCIPKVLERIKSKIIYITEKIDGQSASYYIYNGKFGVCSRNLGISPKDTAMARYWQVARDYNIEDGLRSLSQVIGIKNIAIQCENAGPGIQGNKLKLDKVYPFVFNIFDIDKRVYFNLARNIELIELRGWKNVPLLEESGAPDWSIDEWLKYATRNSVLNSNVKAEGIVVRLAEDMVSRVSFKVINNEFLLKYEKMDEEIQKEFKEKGGKQL